MTDLHVPISKSAGPIREECAREIAVAEAEPFRRDTERGGIGIDNLAKNGRKLHGETFGHLCIRLHALCCIEVAGRAYAAGRVVL